MSLFACDDYPDVEAGCARDAARLFANCGPRANTALAVSARSSKMLWDAFRPFMPSSETIAAMASRPPKTSR